MDLEDRWKTTKYKNVPLNWSEIKLDLAVFLLMSVIHKLFKFAVSSFSALVLFIYVFQGIYLEKRSTCTISICRLLACHLHHSDWKILPFGSWKSFMPVYFSGHDFPAFQINPPHSDNGRQVQHSVGVTWKGVFIASYFICHHLWQTTSATSMDSQFAIFFSEKVSRRLYIVRSK